MFIPEALSSLSWWKTRIDLLSTFHHTRSWTVIFQAIVKAVTIKIAEDYGMEEFKNNTPIFHIVGKDFNYKIPEGVTVNLEIIFNPLSLEKVQLWVDTFTDYLKNGKSSSRFIIKSIEEIEKRNIESLLKGYNLLPQAGELCLEFLTPLPFTPLSDKNRCLITKEQFIKLITGRLKRHTGLEIEYKSEEDDWFLLPYYWHYSEIRHQSLSQPGKVKYINGCAGKLYIKGRWRDFLPFLIITEELHAGTKLSYATGYFRLHLDSPGFFSTNFPEEKMLSSIIIDLINKNDSIDPEKIDEKRRSSEIAEELKSRNYRPAPTTAFRNNENFLLERYTFKDLIVQQYLLRLLERPINMKLHKNAIGYKKGTSLNDCNETITTALKNGYEYIAVFELKSFYNAIGHETLIKMLEPLIPKKDSFILELLNKILKSGYVLDGKTFSREKGLPISSPLSPVLANYYLHHVDEELNKETLCLRYADKFLLLVKTPELLEDSILRTQQLLVIPTTYKKAQSFSLGFLLFDKKFIYLEPSVIDNFNS